MDYLKDYGFTDTDIEEINNSNYKNILDNLVLNREHVQSIVDYLLGIGIEKRTIKRIFMYQVGLFTKTLDDIKTSFDEYELDSVVKSLNYDADNVELIDFV